MSTTPDGKSGNSENASDNEKKQCVNELNKVSNKKRNVTFPESDDKLVTGYLDPPDPWKNVETRTAAELLEEYLDCCTKHSVQPLQTVIEQIQELPAECIGGGCRAPRLSLVGLELSRAVIDSLEALLRRVQFSRIELAGSLLTDEVTDAIFDMIEYYESATCVDVTDARELAIRGWQAISRCIKKTWSLTRLEAGGTPLGESHAAVLARALKPTLGYSPSSSGSGLVALRLHSAGLSGQPLTCLVMSLLQSVTVRELRLSDNRLTPADALQLSLLLGHNTLIHHLDLSDNLIQDAGVGHIADGLVAQSKMLENQQGRTVGVTEEQAEERGLAVLVLWNNQLTRHCTEHLNKALWRSNSLCVLNVGRNALGSEAVGALRGPRLLSLGLQAARLAQGAANALQSLLAYHTKLQRLDLRDNALRVCALRTLAEAVNSTACSLARIDLDDPPQETSLLQISEASGGDAAEVRQLVRDIRAACRRNEAACKRDLTPHRRISLTVRAQPCSAAAALSRCAAVSSGGSARLRSPSPSPAPSPAGSPTPNARPPGSGGAGSGANCRFSVSRVTSDAGHTPSAASRFRVIQVLEPPKISVETSSPPKSPNSRFSVTRNTDAAYRFDKAKTEITTPKNIKLKSHSDDKVTIVVTDASQAKEEHPPQVQDDTPIHRIEAITEDLSSLIQEMQELSEKTSLLSKKSVIERKDDADKTKDQDIFSVQVDQVLEKTATLKKNKSESSLDSPDLEVSRLMRKDKQVFYDSSSSLEVSGSSMESLNAPDTPERYEQCDRKKVTVKFLNLDEINRRYNEKKKAELQPLSTESSIDEQGNTINLSLSSNDSVSPNAFGKHVKIHGSLSSLEASVGSSESTDRVFFGSGDSGIDNPGKNKDDVSSNEGTLTSDSVLKCDKPKIERTRKISWVAPPNFQVKPDPQKPPSHLEKLLSLFQHPTSIFTGQKDQQSSSFWSWGGSEAKCEQDSPDRAPTLTNSDAEMSPDDERYNVTTAIVQKLDLSLVDSDLGDNSKFDGGGATGESAPVASPERVRTFASVLIEGKPKDEAFPSKILLDMKESPSPEDVAKVETQKTFAEIDVGKDALLELDHNCVISKSASHPEGISLSEELKAAELAAKQLDVSPELILDEPQGDTFKVVLKKASSLEDISKEDVQADVKKIGFLMPESSTNPRDIPNADFKARSMSPKSLPESLGKIKQVEGGICRKKNIKKSLGKIAKDSLLALNMSEEEICEFKRINRLQSLDSLKSLESYSGDGSCKSCLKTSQESLMSLDSITEDCSCEEKVTHR